MKKITLFTLLILAVILTFASNKDRYERLHSEAVRTFNTLPDSSIYYARQLLEIAEAAGNMEWYLKANYLVGWQYHYTKGDLGKAIIFYMEGLRATEKSKDPGIKFQRIQHLRNSAMIFWSYDDFERTIKYYESALAISQDLDDKLEQVKNFVSMGDVYYDMDDYEKSIEMYYRAHDLNRSLGNKFWELNTRNELGDALKTSGRYDEALVQFENNLRMIERYGRHEFNEFYVYALHNTAEIHHDLGDLEKAKLGFETSLRLKEESESFVNENPDSYFLALTKLGEVHKDMGDLTTSINYYKRAESFISTLVDQSKKEYFEMFLALADIHEIKGEYQHANSYRRTYSDRLEEYLTMQKEIEMLDKLYSLELILARYNNLVEQRERNARLEYYGAIGISMFVLIVVLMILYSYYQRYSLRSELEKSIRTIQGHQV